METTTTKQAQMRLKDGQVHVQVKDGYDNYRKFDIPATPLLETHIRSEILAGKNVLSLAGEGNSDQYVPVEIVLKKVTQATMSITVSIPLDATANLDDDYEE